MTSEKKIANKIKKAAHTQSKQPGHQSAMVPKPKTEEKNYQPSQKLKNKVAIITGGDSGIGRAIAVLFAKEGADIAIIYLNEHEDARKTQEMVEGIERECLTISGDIGNQKFCKKSYIKNT